jgi:uncharacterized surface protein with fasciclin (FAS1) repeats
MSDQPATDDVAPQQDETHAHAADNRSRDASPMDLEAAATKIQTRYRTKIAKQEAEDANFADTKKRMQKLF